MGDFDALEELEACTHACLHTHRNASIHTYAHKQTHTHTHTYVTIHACTYTLRLGDSTIFIHYHDSLSTIMMMIVLLYYRDSIRHDI